VIITSKEQNDKAFKPFTFEVTIENVNELRELWHRVDLSKCTIKEQTFSDAEWKGEEEEGDCYSIWKHLDDIMLERNIKP
jgi:hypothetical protein